MYVHLMSVHKYLWVAITNKHFIPKSEVGNSVKHPKDWIDDETKKASDDSKARNICIVALSTKIYYSISHHKSSQILWNALQVLYKRTKDIKDSRINTLTEEYELFYMESSETVESMQNHFLHLINKLDNLGKSFF